VIKGLQTLVRTTTFRVAIAFAGLFAGFAVLLLGFLYATTVGRLGLEADQAARAELRDLSLIWDTQGPEALNSVVIQRAARSSDTLYVLVAPDGETISGNIDAAPLDLSRVTKPPQGAPLDPRATIATGFSYERQEFDGTAVEKRRARGVFLAGSDGYGLFVARDLGPGVEIADRVARVIWMGGAAVLAFALIGGFVAARQAASRVDELTRTTQAVRAGNLQSRAAVRTLRPGEGDEFDALTDDLNAMLERIERLVMAARTTGDSIAHDLRSPLTRLRNRLEASAANAKSEEDFRDGIERALEDVDGIVTTFNAVLRLARLEAGEGGKLEKIDASLLLVEIADMFEPAIEEKGLSFSCSIAPDLWVMADKSLLAQALSNLVDNAIKYTESGGIHIEGGRSSAGLVKLSVTDTGVGIPPADRDRVMGRFVRLDAARSQPGSGIGLSLTSAIAELHKGILSLSDGHPTVLADGQETTGLKASIVLPFQA
jgi:signal transduction histidine kinase